MESSMEVERKGMPGSALLRWIMNTPAKIVHDRSVNFVNEWQESKEANIYFNLK